jgi:twitching motility protein PilT
MNVEELFMTMVEKQCSHLHLIPGSPIMMRKGTEFTPLDGYVLSPQDTQAVAETIMSEQLKAEFEQTQQTDFAFSVPGLSRFRINCFRQRGSAAIVIATNPPAPPTIEELGLPDAFRKTVLEADSGLIMITGPKGSGKAHTLAAIVNYLLEVRPCTIVSIENPIDFLHKNRKGCIAQREIGTDVPSYEQALRVLPYQGADVLVITGVEEFAIAERIVNLSAGGNLVICTSTSPTAMVLVEKLVDLYPPQLQQQARVLLSVGLKAVISQTLCTKASGDGVAAAFELLIATPPIKGLLKEGKFAQIQSFIGTTGRETGMSTQELALRALVKKNTITEAEAYKRAVRPEDFKKVLALPY